MYSYTFPPYAYVLRTYIISMLDAWYVAYVLVGIRIYVHIKCFILKKNGRIKSEYWMVNCEYSERVYLPIYVQWIVAILSQAAACILYVSNRLAYLDLSTLQPHFSIGLFYVYYICSLLMSKASWINTLLSYICNYT